MSKKKEDSFLAKMQKIQNQIEKDMQATHTKLNKMVAEGRAGGDMVIVQLTGNGDVKKIKISPDVVNPKEVSMLEDLLVSAFSEAQQRAQELLDNEMNTLSGGMDFDEEDISKLFEEDH